MVYASPLTLLGKTGCKNYFVICNYTPIFRFTVSVASSKAFPSYSCIASAPQSLCVIYWVSRQVGKVPISSVLDGGVITYSTVQYTQGHRHHTGHRSHSGGMSQYSATPSSCYPKLCPITEQCENGLQVRHNTGGIRSLARENLTK